MYYKSKSNITWEQAFAEVNASVLRHEIICAIASEVAGKPVENLIGFTDEQKESVWCDYYNTTELCG
jgi:hypothetical protein